MKCQQQQNSFCSVRLLENWVISNKIKMQNIPIKSMVSSVESQMGKFVHKKTPLCITTQAMGERAIIHASAPWQRSISRYGTSMGLLNLGNILSLIIYFTEVMKTKLVATRRSLHGYMRKGEETDLKNEFSSWLKMSNIRECVQNRM